MRLGISGSAAVALLVGALVALPAVGAAPSLSFVRVFATSAGGEATRGFVFDPPFAGGAYVAGE